MTTKQWEPQVITSDTIDSYCSSSSCSSTSSITSHSNKLGSKLEYSFERSVLVYDDNNELDSLPHLFLIGGTSSPSNNCLTGIKYQHLSNLNEDTIFLTLGFLSHNDRNNVILVSKQNKFSMVAKRT